MKIDRIVTKCDCGHELVFTKDVVECSVCGATYYRNVMEQLGPFTREQIKWVESVEDWERV